MIGIAGCGMRALAQVLFEFGWRLTGSDLEPLGDVGLPAGGIQINTGHAVQNVPLDADLIIYSDAIPDDNCERLRATELGIEQKSYARMLGELMANRVGLAVAGTHGKSTTVAMTAAIFDQAGLSPTVVGGAAPIDRHSGGRRGRGPFLLAEACEYRSNFLHLSPQMAVILGIEPDHFDCFVSREALEAAFAAFAQRVPADGLLLGRASCAATRRALAGASCRTALFDVEASADWQAEITGSALGRYHFKLTNHGRCLGHVALTVPGRHQVFNAVAAAALAAEAGAGARHITRGLSQYAGLKRRLEIVGIRNDIVLVDDYSHHPTQIAATLDAVQEVYPGRRIWCIFQPHQSSRTLMLMDDFAVSLSEADCLAVTEIYQAREPADESALTLAMELAARVRARRGMVLTQHATNDILEQVLDDLTPGDVLLTLGAGDVRKICDVVAERLRVHRAAG
jgi:UDP-N-acetylmuramate--alanine ligase